MKKVFAIFLALVLMPATQVQAWVGGPFGNGRSHTAGGDDGIYEAIGTIEDGLGVYRWAVRNSSGLQAGAGAAIAGGNTIAGSTTSLTGNVTFGGLAGASSSHIWYYRGLTYYGQCFGTANSALNVVTCVGNASDNGLDGAAIPVNNIALSGSSSDNVSDGTTGTFGANVGVLGVGSADRKSFCNSNFIGAFDTSEEDYSAVRRFRGRGEVTFFGAPDQRFFLIDTSAAGFSPAGDFAQVDVTFGGNDDKFVRQGHTRKLNVFGSRVSRIVTGTEASGF